MGDHHNSSHDRAPSPFGPTRAGLDDRDAEAKGSAIASVLDAVGSTPLALIDGIWVKLEYLNPSGSIKARIAKYIVDRAEREGLLRPGDTIVEASSGNTGNALSMVAAAKGYKMIVVIPSGLSNERSLISRAFGATVEEIGNFHINEAIAHAAELATQPGHFCPSQFESEWNIEENREWLGPEILGQMPPGATPDAFVMGVGTGGTLIGVGQALRSENPDLLLVGVEPDSSCTLLCGDVAEHPIEGIADGLVPGIVQRNRDLIDEVVAVDDGLALEATRHIARAYGMFVGPSSGANLVAAKRVAQAHPELRSVVTIFADEGEKYLSTHFGSEASASSQMS